MTAEVTRDAFLGGKLILAQPVSGYRAGVDPVLLAASVQAKAGQNVLELGCGTGAALLCLGARVKGLALTGIEIQADYARLAQSNADANRISARIVQSDLRDMPADLRNSSFDHVIANPPYFDRTTGSASPTPDRELAFGEETPLSEWVEIATRRLAPKGCLTMILKAERLPDLIRATDTRLGHLSIRPIVGRAGRSADRVLFSARKAARVPARLLSPLVLHEGEAHLADSEDYTPEIREVLRNGARLAAFD